MGEALKALHEPVPPSVHVTRGVSVDRFEAPRRLRVLAGVQPLLEMTIGTTQYTRGEASPIAKATDYSAGI